MLSFLITSIFNFSGSFLNPFIYSKSELRAFILSSLFSRASLSELEFVESSLFGIKKLQANLKEFIFNLQEDKNGGLLKDYLEGVPLNKLSLDYGIPQEKIKANLQSGYIYNVSVFTIVIYLHRSSI